MSDTPTVSRSGSPVDLQGNLGQTALADLVQFLGSSLKTGKLTIEAGPEGRRGALYFETGRLVHVATGGKSGMDAFVVLLGWTTGDFEFVQGAAASLITIRMPVTHALMDAMRLRDEHHGATPLPRKDREKPMLQTARDSTAVLEDLLKVPGVEAAVVVGRDGFVIESTGNTHRVNIDSLGAAVAHAINSVEEMGAELEIQGFKDLFIEYGQAVIMCRPCGDAVVCLLTPDASKLGIIRHKAGKHFLELRHFF